MHTDNQAAGIRRHLDYPEKTMFQMIEDIASRYPDAPACDFYNRKTSYRKFISNIETSARVLLSLGLGPGDRVTLCLPNIPQALTAFYAVNRIGAVANMIHPLSAEEEITGYLNYAGSPLLITVDMFYEKARAAASRADHEVRIIVVRIQDELPMHLRGLYTLKSGLSLLKFPQGNDLLWSRIMKNPGNAPLPGITFDAARTSVILYSGGTTGHPKGICLTDLNFNALAMQCREFIETQFRPGLTMLSCMPLFHGFGLGINIHTVLVYGVCCILMPSFNLKTYSQMLIKKRPNFIAGVPTIFDALLNSDSLKDADLSFLLGMFCGGDTLPVELKHRVDAFLRGHHASIQIREGYGLTECVTASCLTPKDEYREKSIGLPFPDTYYDIVKPGTDISCPCGTEGEIVLRGPSVMLGYLDNPEETAKVLRKRSDGHTWLYTGDLGRMDEDGYIYFVQRIKRMIITNGYNVYPAVLEDAINSISCVDYCSVIGVKDPRRGQRVRACVVLHEGVSENDETKNLILKELKKKVAAYALPKEIVFMKSLPRTLVGKVAWHELEKQAEERSA